MAGTSSKSNESGAEYLAAQLERLLRLPLGTSEDVEKWDKECAAVQTELESRFPAFEVEHHLWHFFTDSDIRCKDPGYRQRQHQAVSEYIERLRHGTR
jgi:hypothetical protein